MAGGYGSNMAALPGFTRITSDPAVLGGKPCVAGTRLSVEQALQALAMFPEWAELKANYPSLEKEDVPEILRFAALVMGGDLHPLSLPAAK